MIYVYNVYNHKYWGFEPLLADVTIWQEFQNAYYIQYIALAIL